MKKVLVLPGWMTGVKLYKNNIEDFYVCLGKLDEKSLSADYIVGNSLGALVVLQDISKTKGKVILVNPPLPKRNFFVWLARWLKYVKNDGLFLERQKFTINPIKFILELIHCIRLLNIDFSKTLDNISENKITVVRAKNDIYFCDEEAVKFLHSKNIRIVEFDSGHNLSQEMEDTINSLTV